MAISFVSIAVNTESTSASSLAFSAASVQVGDSIIISVTGRNTPPTQTISSITDSVSNTYQQVPGVYLSDSANGAWKDIWWCPSSVSAAASLTGTVNFSGAVQIAELGAVLARGISTPTFTGAEGATAATGSLVNGQSFSGPQVRGNPLPNAAFYLTTTFVAGTWTGPTGWTLASNDGSYQHFYLISGGFQQPNFSATMASSGGDISTASFGQVFSLADDRNYGNFPNNSRIVQGTLIYDVSAHESRAAGAPVDSRAGGAPVDSRIAAAKRNNSRLD